MKPTHEKVSKTQQIIEANAKDAPVKDVLWNANEIQTGSTPLIDPGVGTTNVLRHFFFKSLPLPKGVPKPDKHEIVSHYKKLIETTLWGDGLIIREDKPLEVHSLQKAKGVSQSLYTKMLKEGADFVILCLATPRKGQTVTNQASKI